MGTEYESWGKYYSYEGHVNNAMLNNTYGDAGMFFKSLADAERHQSITGGIIYPISNYFSTQVHCEFGEGKNKKSYRIVIDDGAKRHLEGYLVSHPHKPKDNVISYNKYKGN